MNHWQKHMDVERKKKKYTIKECLSCLTIFGVERDMSKEKIDVFCFISLGIEW